jgi:hypothetical protein
MPFVSKVISGANSFTDPIQIVGSFNLSIVGSTSPAWDGTLTVQRSRDGSTWRDVDTWVDVSSEEVGYDPMLMYYRAGVKTGEYTAGSVTVSINGQATLPGASS